MQTEKDEYWDLGLMETCVQVIHWSIDENGQRREQQMDCVIPEGTMTELEKLLGDGQATVTVGSEFKASENYRSAGSTAYVKLTCNQDLASILATREAATTLSLAFAQQGFEQAQHTLGKMFGEGGEPPAPLVIDSTAPKERPKKPKAGPKLMKRPMFTR